MTAALCVCVQAIFTPSTLQFREIMSPTRTQLILTVFLRHKRRVHVQIETILALVPQEGGGPDGGGVRGLRHLVEGLGPTRMTMKKLPPGNI